MAVVQHSFAEFAQARDAASQDSGDPAARLLARCRAYTRFALANPGPYRYLFSQHAPTGDPDRPPVDLPTFQALAESISRWPAGRRGPRPATTRTGWPPRSGPRCTAWCCCA